jgi:magnesium-transporting ATPase (P-type)
MAVAKQFGLDTDWNVCILLAEPEKGELDKGAARTHGTSKLPRGVSAIRQHLKSVDNVPLLVSLFAECDHDNMAEMIRIYKENGETVCVLGSSLRVDNIPIFTEADVAMSLDPLPFRQCAYDHGGVACRPHEHGKGSDYLKYTAFAASREISTLPCAYRFDAHSSLFEVGVLVAQGRKLLSNLRQALAFALCAHSAHFLLLFALNLANVPPILTMYHNLWLCWVILPLLTLPMLFSPRDGALMSSIASKNDKALFEDRMRWGLYFVAQFVPSVSVYIAIFLWIVHETSGFGEAVLTSYYWDLTSNELADDNNFRTALLKSQNYALVAWVWFLAVHSMTMVHRNLSLRAYNPFTNKLWAACAAGAVLLQIMFCAISVSSSEDSSVRYTSIDPYIYIIVAVWPLFVIAITELTKAHDRRTVDRQQRKARLEFDTKLGMHSPK